MARRLARPPPRAPIRITHISMGGGCRFRLGPLLSQAVSSQAATVFSTPPVCRLLHGACKLHASPSGTPAGSQNETSIRACRKETSISLPAHSPHDWHSKRRVDCSVLDQSPEGRVGPEIMLCASNDASSSAKSHNGRQDAASVSPRGRQPVV